MNPATIKISNLTKQYKNALAVKGINFEINKGKIMGLLGPNGCGKSTTIGMMLGLIKPTSGSVTINGLNIENNRLYAEIGPVGTAIKSHESTDFNAIKSNFISITPLTVNMCDTKKIINRVFKPN